jgi:3-(3-hydroxy-phenyl)propionate hydroxylase
MTADAPPVIVAGAGPAGCVTALYLARHGVPVVLLEGESRLPLDLRASTMHPPTLDMLDDLGVASKLIPQGLVARHYQHRDRRTGEAATFDLGLIADATRHPYRLQCEQFKLTQAIVEMLGAYPHAQVLFDHRVEQVVQDADGVTVHAETPDAGFRSFLGTHAVGADGASSRVRRALCVNFEGFTYPERFLVLSTPFDFAPALPGLTYVNYVADVDEWCVLLRTPSLWRVLVPTDPTAHDAEVLSEPHAQRCLQRIVARDAPYQVEHRTLYRVHQRVAARWRIGRVVLVGDACHVNNPLGGMGMNGGLHDAFSAAAALVAIRRGEADERALDRYERQRRTVCVRFVQEQTKKNKQAIEDRDPERQKRHLEELQRIAADPGRARAFLLRSSMIDSLREAAAIE